MAVSRGLSPVLRAIEEDFEIDDLGDRPRRRDPEGVGAAPSGESRNEYAPRPIHGHADGIVERVSRSIACRVEDLGDCSARSDLEGVVA